MVLREKPGARLYGWKSQDALDHRQTSLSNLGALKKDRSWAIWVMKGRTITADGIETIENQ